MVYYKSEKSKDDFIVMKIGIKTITEKELTDEAILVTYKNLKSTDLINIGAYGDFKIELSFDSFKQEYSWL